MKNFVILSLIFIALGISIEVKAENPDLLLFDLRGPVKSVNISQTSGPDIGYGLFTDNHSFNFTENGSWKTSSAVINIKGNPKTFDIKRNSSGYIINLNTNMGWVSSLAVNLTWQNAELRSIRYSLDLDAEGTTESTTTFSYNSKGLVSNISYNCSSCEGDCEIQNYDISVDNINIDQYGNWTKRVLNIKGYKYNDYDNSKSVVNEKITQTRRITYW